MTGPNQPFLDARQKLMEANAYNPADEHSACGVGLVAALDGTPRREIVEMGIKALKNVWHRGAVDADGKTGDGAGIRLDVPQEFFRDQIKRTGHTPTDAPICVGQIFLPGLILPSRKRRGQLSSAKFWRWASIFTVGGSRLLMCR